VLDQQTEIWSLMMKEKDSKYRREENDRDWPVLASVSLIETFRKLEFDCSCCFCYSKAHQEPDGGRTIAS